MISEGKASRVKKQLVEKPGCTNDYSQVSAAVGDLKDLPGPQRPNKNKHAARRREDGL